MYVRPWLGNMNDHINIPLVDILFKTLNGYLLKFYTVL